MSKYWTKIVAGMSFGISCTGALKHKTEWIQKLKYNKGKRCRRNTENNFKYEIR